MGPTLPILTVSFLLLVLPLQALPTARGLLRGVLSLTEMPFCWSCPLSHHPSTSVRSTVPAPKRSPYSLASSSKPSPAHLFCLEPLSPHPTVVKTSQVSLWLPAVTLESSASLRRASTLTLNPPPIQPQVPTQLFSITSVRQVP